jgi:hypothetical protein
MDLTTTHTRERLRLIKSQNLLGDAALAESLSTPPRPSLREEVAETVRQLEMMLEKKHKLLALMDQNPAFEEMLGLLYS